jgi:hypothetical protein
MVIDGTKARHMGEYQPVSLVRCAENIKRMLQFDHPQGPKGLGLTLIQSRAIKKRANHQLFGRV